MELSSFSLLLWLSLPKPLPDCLSLDKRLVAAPRSILNPCVCVCHFSFLLLFGYWENEGKYAGRNGNVWLLLFVLCLGTVHVNAFVFQFFELVLSYYLIFVVFRLWDGKFRIGFDSKFSSLWFCTVIWVFWVLQFVLQFFELVLSYFLIFVVFRLWDGEIRNGFDSNFSSLWLCTVNWVLQFVQYTGIVEDCCCDYETVDRLNKEVLHPSLQELVKTPFFRYFKVCQLFWFIG